MLSLLCADLVLMEKNIRLLGLRKNLVLELDKVSIAIHIAENGNQAASKRG